MPAPTTVRVTSSVGKPPTRRDSQLVGALSQVKTYANDDRLAGVANTGLSAGHFSTFTFTSTREDQVASIAETSDATAVYPSALTQTGTYNTLNQLTVLSGQALTWDTVGNVIDDGQRTYTWDAENRLVGIGYPAQPGKATAFAYDGLGRRVSITETPPGGGTPVTTNYLWCGDALCQARDGGNVTTRSYYDEGEFVPGAPGQPYYYGIDQLGSVRRAFASTSSAPAFNYDPYGAPLAGPAPTTDFGYAGLFNHQASGLNLTLYRAYDPVAGRWLSRDPIGERGDPYGNLYTYVSGRTTNAVDPLGLFAAVGLAFNAKSFGPRKIAPFPTGDDCTPLPAVDDPSDDGLKLASSLQSLSSDSEESSHSAITPVSDNRRQNKEFRDVVVKLKLTPHQAQLLHREITGQGYGYHEILATAKEMFGK